MKQFTFFRRTTFLMALGLIMSLTAFSQHFGDVNGNPLDDTWNAYLDQVKLDGNTPDADDELGVFDGNTLVGSFTFTGNESNLDNVGSSGQTDYSTVCFTELDTENGYDPGNEITFKYWDASESVEITASFGEGIFLDFGGNEYTDDGDGTPEFPAGDNPFSFMKLNFNSGYSVSGTVTLAGCEGDVTNVLVSIYDDNDNLVGTDYPDADGNYEVGGIPQGTGYELEATLTNYEPYTWNFSISSDKAKDFTMTAFTGTITVDVTNAANGNTISNATVELFDSEGNPLDSDNSSPYKFFNTCMGTYYAEVSHSNYTNETTENVTLDEDGQSETLSVTLDPLPGSISGQIKDAQTGNPISGAHVSITNYNVDPPEELFNTVADENGYYSAGDVTAGTWYVKAEATDYISDSSQYTVNANSSTTGANINLTPSPGSLEGTVRISSTNALLSGVEVEVVGETTVPGTATTNGSGVYSFTEVPAGTVDVKFSKNGFETTTVSDVTINPNGTTTSNAYLDFEHGELKVTLNNLNEGGSGQASVTIGDDYTATYNNNQDKYIFSSIPAAVYDVDIEHPNFHNATLENVQVVSGQTTNKTYTMVPYHWTFAGGNSMESVWTIYLQEVTVDGNPVDVADEIAIFDGSKMVGLYYVDETLNSGNATNQVLKAYSELNSTDGYTAGNSYSFKLYDQSAGAEFDIPQVYLSDPYNEGAFTGDVFPSGMAPFSFAKLEFFTTINITHNLQTGYQIISSRVEANNMDMGSIFGSVGGHVDYVKNEDGLQYRKISGSWTNNIGNWNVEEGYLVKMNSADNITMTGTPVNPQRDIELEQGYNLISYLPSSSMNAATAFSSIQNDLIFVRDSDGNHYWKIGGNWVNNIGDLKPGEGYFVKMSADATLSYPSTRGSSSAEEESKPQYYTFNGGDATNIVYTIYVKSDDLQPGDEVAAYDGDQLVGSGVIEESAGFEQNDLNIFRITDAGEGFNPGDDITFKVWSPRTNQEYTNVEVDFINPYNDAHSNGSFPAQDGNYSIAKLGVNELGIGDSETASQFTAYPNPAQDVLTVESKDDISRIRVSNMVGKIILDKKINSKEHTINTNNFVPGIYILETTINNQTRSIRFAVK